MATTRTKGNVLENIVALLHHLPGVKVEARVRLPSVRQGSTRKREIDVLLTSSIAGYPVRLAIECKNDKYPIKSEKIDSFLAKLDDVGIPHGSGIFVTASRFRKDALKLAVESGVRPLVLESLNSKRLGLEVNAALQSLVFLLVTWTTLDRFDNEEPTTALNGPFIVTEFPPELGEGTPAILTHLWQLWRDRRIPDTLGAHDIAIRMPSVFRYSLAEEPVHNSLVIATVEVTAHIASIPGRVGKAILRNAATSELEKLHISAEFEELAASLKLNRFDTEADLKAFIEQTAVHLVTRVRVPRIVSEMSFWPPTREAIKKILQLKQEGKETSFDRIEGENLSRA